jgi:hypothetical protein
MSASDKQLKLCAVFQKLLSQDCHKAFRVRQRYAIEHNGRPKRSARRIWLSSPASGSRPHKQVLNRFGHGFGMAEVHGDVSAVDQADLAARD